MRHRASRPGRLRVTAHFNRTQKLKRHQVLEVVSNPDMEIVTVASSHRFALSLLLEATATEVLIRPLVDSDICFGRSRLLPRHKITKDLFRREPQPPDVKHKLKCHELLGRIVESVANRDGILRVYPKTARRLKAYATLGGSGTNSKSLLTGEPLMPRLNKALGRPQSTVTCMSNSKHVSHWIDLVKHW